MIKTKGSFSENQKRRKDTNESLNSKISSGDSLGFYCLIFLDFKDLFEKGILEFMLGKQAFIFSIKR